MSFIHSLLRSAFGAGECADTISAARDNSLLEKSTSARDLANTDILTVTARRVVEYIQSFFRPACWAYLASVASTKLPSKDPATGKERIEFDDGIFGRVVIRDLSDDELTALNSELDQNNQNPARAIEIEINGQFAVVTDIDVCQLLREIRQDIFEKKEQYASHLSKNNPEINKAIVLHKISQRTPLSEEEINLSLPDCLIKIGTEHIDSNDLTILTAIYNLNDDKLTTESAGILGQLKPDEMMFLEYLRLPGFIQTLNDVAHSVDSASFGHHITRLAYLVDNRDRKTFCDGLKIKICENEDSIAKLTFGNMEIAVFGFDKKLVLCDRQFEKLEDGVSYKLRNPNQKHEKLNRLLIDADHFWNSLDDKDEKLKIATEKNTATDVKQMHADIYRSRDCLPMESDDPDVITYMKYTDLVNANFKSGREGLINKLSHVAENIYDQFVDLTDDDRSCFFSDPVKLSSTGRLLREQFMALEKNDQRKISICINFNDDIFNEFKKLTREDQRKIVLNYADKLSVDGRQFYDKFETAFKNLDDSQDKLVMMDNFKFVYRLQYPGDADELYKEFTSFEMDKQISLYFPTHQGIKMLFPVLDSEIRYDSDWNMVLKLKVPKGSAHAEAKYMFKPVQVDQSKYEIKFLGETYFVECSDDDVVERTTIAVTKNVSFDYSVAFPDGQMPSIENAAVGIANVHNKLTLHNRDGSIPEVSARLNSKFGLSDEVLTMCGGQLDSNIVTGGVSPAERLVVSEINVGKLLDDDDPIAREKEHVFPQPRMEFI